MLITFYAARALVPFLESLINFKGDFSDQGTTGAKLMKFCMET